MKRFLLNVALLSIPLVLYLIVVAIMDPFNYLNWSKAITDETKKQISFDVEPHLFKMLEFENNPRRNLMLGDSRTNSLYVSMDQEEWSNLGFRGGTLKEMVQAFWWAVEEHEFDTIVMGVSFNLYNKYNKRFWVEETVETKKNFFSYSFNKYTFRSVALITKSLLNKEEVELLKTGMSREEFWQWQITEIPDRFFGQYAYPDNYYEDLRSIADYCRSNKIKLILWIPPTHSDFQQRLEEFDLQEEQERFKLDLTHLGDLYDYNYPNELTKNKENFADPLHFNRDIANRIREEILGNQEFIARKIKTDPTP